MCPLPSPDPLFTSLLLLAGAGEEQQGGGEERAWGQHRGGEGGVGPGPSGGRRLVPPFLQMLPHWVALGWARCCPLHCNGGPAFPSNQAHSPTPHLVQVHSSPPPTNTTTATVHPLLPCRIRPTPLPTTTVSALQAVRMEGGSGQP